MITLVLRRAGQRQGDATLRSQLESEILLIQASLEGGVKCGQQDQGVFFPWFMYKEAAALALGVSTETVALPSDFVAEYDEEHGHALWYYNASHEQVWVPVKKDTLGIIRARHSGVDVAPSAYAIVGENIYVRPLVTSALLLRLAYYGQQTTLVTNVENNWLKYAPDVMVGELVSACGEIVHNEAMVTKGEAASKQARDRLYAMHVQREEAARQRQRGDD